VGQVRGSVIRLFYNYLINYQLISLIFWEKKIFYLTKKIKYDKLRRAERAKKIGTPLKKNIYIK
jgi:hypothetical protein